MCVYCLSLVQSWPVNCRSQEASVEECSRMQMVCGLPSIGQRRLTKAGEAIGTSLPKNKIPEFVAWLCFEYHRIVQEADPERLNGELWFKVVKIKVGKWSVISTHGCNWLTSIPSMVASQLGLPCQNYTGHCFRRTRSNGRQMQEQPL